MNEHAIKYPLIEYNSELIVATSHPLFSTYHNIKNRCYNKKVNHYDRYGGVGVTMSSEWLNSFTKFVQDMGDKPSSKHSIERVNNLKGYSKENCCWATAVTQANNKRNNITLTYKNETLSIIQWSIKLNVAYSALYCRYYRGWTIEEIFNKPYRMPR